MSNAPEVPPRAPGPIWRAGSHFVVGMTGLISWAFLRGVNRIDVQNLPAFEKILEERHDPAKRERGLITVSNHQSVLDDPLMWGALPLKYFAHPDNMRWSLGSHDIVFKNKAFETFFNVGQVLPCHRLKFSQYGGLFQPTIAQSIRLLSSRPFAVPPSHANSISTPPVEDITDPFSSSELTYTTNGTDVVPSPSAYESRRHAWVHVFPEGKIHQHPDRIMRYFKWGVSRLILESEPCPDLVPIWIEGFEQIMHEDRAFPRPLPRIGKQLLVRFGDKVDMEARFGDLRKRWKKMFEDARDSDTKYTLGEIPDVLKTRQDAVKLREECTMRVREEVLKLRQLSGLPDEDPKCSLADTWREEGRTTAGEGKRPDGSWVKEE